MPILPPTQEELASGITAEHLLDDYTVSRNIARYGLKHVLFGDMLGFKQFPVYHQPNEFFYPVFHEYRCGTEAKVAAMQQNILIWAQRAFIQVKDPNEMRDKCEKMIRETWGLKDFPTINVLPQQGQAPAQLLEPTPVKIDAEGRATI